MLKERVRIIGTGLAVGAMIGASLLALPGGAVVVAGVGIGAVVHDITY
jgi:hypothetical protein